MTRTVTNNRTQGQSQFALQFFVVTSTIFIIAGTLAFLLIQSISQASLTRVVHFPPAFGLSTVLLALGSGALNRAVRQVRIERQKPFRRALILALVAGTIFVTVQSYGLYCLIQMQLPAEVQTGVNAFVFVFAALHGLHFTVALMFLIYVTLKSLRDRYDHEYYWGVTVCAWFWHFLAAVWLCILAVFAITA